MDKRTHFLDYVLVLPTFFLSPAPRLIKPSSSFSTPGLLKSTCPPLTPSAVHASLNTDFQISPWGLLHDMEVDKKISNHTQTQNQVAGKKIVFITQAWTNHDSFPNHFYELRSESMTHVIWVPNELHLSSWWKISGTCHSHTALPD